MPPPVAGLVGCTALALPPFKLAACNGHQVAKCLSRILHACCLAPSRSSAGGRFRYHRQPAGAGLGCRPQRRRARHRWVLSVAMRAAPAPAPPCASSVHAFRRPHLNSPPVQATGTWAGAGRTCGRGEPTAGCCSPPSETWLCLHLCISPTRLAAGRFRLRRPAPAPASPPLQPGAVPSGHGCVPGGRQHLHARTHPD